ncbi:MAG: glycosyltransferase family 4 protein [Anaerolineae bacterium]
MTETYRILMVAPTSFFLDYGCHVRILEEVRALQQLGHQVTIITYYMGRDIPGLEIVRTRSTPWRADYEVGSSRHKIAFDALLGWTGLKIVLRRRFDIIHSHLHDGALIGYFLSQIQRIPLVADFQGSMTAEMVDHHFLNPDGPWYYWVRLLETRIDHLPNIIVTSTTQAAQMLKEDFDCDPDRVLALPDRVNVDFFHPDVLSHDQIAAQRTALGVPTGWPVAVYLGLLADYQGIPHLVQAARILKERGVEVCFLIGGFPGVPGYRQMAADMGVGDRVIFRGKIPREETPVHLALGDIAVAPKISTTEGCGKILEYMAMRLPTVAFDAPQNREYMENLGTYANQTGDPVALADAIAGLLNDPQGCIELGQKLRERAIRHFSWDRVGRDLVAVYRTVLTSKT